MKKYIPNFLTIIRGFFTFIIIILFFLNINYKFETILIFFTIASASDFLDGYLARKWKVVSDFGKIFDPLFDKILTLSLYMLLIPYNIIHPVFFIILLIRELFVDGFKNYLLSKKIVVQARLSGKIKMIFQVIMIFSALLFLIFENNVFSNITLISTILSIISAYYSAFKYLQQFAQIKN